MNSISLFMETMGGGVYSTSPQENWFRSEDEQAQEAFKRGRISQQQYKENRDEVRKMSKEPGGIAKAGTFTYSNHESKKNETGSTGTGSTGSSSTGTGSTGTRGTSNTPGTSKAK